MAKKLTKEERAAINRENGAKGGRPKGYAALAAEKAREILIQKLEKEWDPIVTEAIKQAKKGDATARAWLTERGFGKIKDEIDLNSNIKTVIVNKKK